jgi:hypothetical protein
MGHVAARGFTKGIGSILASADDATLTADPHLGDRMAEKWRRFGANSGVVRKLARNRKTCGKKDTTTLPHRGTSI